MIEPLLKDPRTRKLSFTGSTEVGRRLIEQSAEQILRVSMELGGNAPFLVFEDADLDAAVEGAVHREDAQRRRGVHGGQPLPRARVAAPTSSPRALAERMGRLKVGRGTEPGVDVGPLIDDKQRAKVAELVARRGRAAARACSSAAQRSTGRATSSSPPCIADVPDDARLLREEIFGPVAPIATFSTDEQALEAANRTEYGLVAYVYTRDLDRAIRVCEAIESGMVGLNQGVVSNPAAPFGGVKQSGFGREGGFEGIDEYLETKYVAMSV